MREIKYRAWDKLCKIPRMKSWEQLLAQYQLTQVFTSNYFELMQYTGLKDKNGTEIYEGDIVRADMDFGPGGMAEQIASIYWDEGVGGWQFNYFDKSTIEIIGNIYENPELLVV